MQFWRSCHSSIPQGWARDSSWPIRASPHLNSVTGPEEDTWSQQSQSQSSLAHKYWGIKILSLSPGSQTNRTYDPVTSRSYLAALQRKPAWEQNPHLVRVSEKEANDITWTPGSSCAWDITWSSKFFLLLNMVWVEFLPPRSTAEHHEEAQWILVLNFLP